jgi:MATE family multidrug resistance protein
VLRQASIFLWIRLLSLFPTLAFIVVRAYLQALHITRPMVDAMVAGNLFNFVADMLLVFGGSNLPSWCGPLRLVPAMGITGAAIATVIGSFLQLWIIAVAVKKIDIPEEGSNVHRLLPDDLRHAVRVGMPVGLQMGAEYGVFALVGVLAGRFGALQLAAHQTALTLISFSFTVAVGIGSAGSVRVGRAVGERNMEGVRRAGLAAFSGGVGVMIASALIFLFFPYALARVITNDAAVIAAAIPLLAVAAFFQLSDGIQGVGAGVLRGAGDTRYSFVANIIGHWLIGFPTALWFGFHLHLGVVGLWWGLCAGLTAVAFMLFIRFLVLSKRDIRPLHAL